MALKYVLIEKKDGVALITLNRPGALNAVNEALARDLVAVIKDCHEDSNLRAAIITGRGRAFCTGMDLKAIGSSYEAFELMGEYSRLMHQLKIPLIAAVNGFAVTAGFELAVNCDIILAGEKALFADTHARLGVIPGEGNSQILPRLVGEKRAKEILFTSDYVTAREAERIGLANRVVRQEKLISESWALAWKIAAQPAQAIQKIKKMVDDGLRMDLRSALAMEKTMFIEHISMMGAGNFEKRRGDTIEKGRQLTRSKKPAKPSSSG